MKFEHNKIRNSVACGVYQTSPGNKQKYPKAAEMKTFKWDKELEYLSRLMSSSCDEAIAESYCFQSKRFDILGSMSWYSYNTMIYENHSTTDPLANMYYFIRTWSQSEVADNDELGDDAS